MTPHKYPFDWVEFHAWKRSRVEHQNNEGRTAGIVAHQMSGAGLYHAIEKMRYSEGQLCEYARTGRMRIK